uniref:Uncharacterized protein n=1 Tax=Zea mays TaxID=4577 RepID=C4J2Q1_MAIZE|nr:unknown [Zea mays]
MQLASLRGTVAARTSSVLRTKLHHGTLLSLNYPTSACGELHTT